jgi:hypothetical protein
MTELKYKQVFLNGREVGELREDNLVFRTIRKDPEHIYRKLNSVGFSVSVIEYLKKITDNKLIQIQVTILRPNNKVELYKLTPKVLEIQGQKVIDPQAFKEDIQVHIDIPYLKEINLC